MFAIFKNGGKQYSAVSGSVLDLELMEGEAGSEVSFSEVIFVKNGDSSQVGTPFVAGAKVIGEIVTQTRGPKLIIFKKRRRQGYHLKKGHRQEITRVRIKEIQA